MVCGSQVPINHLMRGSCFRQMPHSFVVAKFLPQRSATWTSHYGLEKAASFKSHPFLALRVSRTDIGMQNLDLQEQFLFAISPKKPTGVNDGCYFALGSSLDKEKKMLRVEPPLRPGGRTLYVHTFSEASRGHDVQALARNCASYFASA